MKIAIVGSRHFKDYDRFVATIEFFFDTENVEIVSGGAEGTDTMARQYAKEHNLKFTEFKPLHGNTFGQKCFNRNKQIVDYSEVILAFWDGRTSKCGTLLTMQLAVKAEKRMYCRGISV